MLEGKAAQAETKEKRRRDREATISIAIIQMEMLARHFDKRREVSHNIFQRIVKSLLRIGGHIPLSVERAEGMEKALRDAGVKEPTISLDGDRIYLEGYFDLDKLRQEVLW